MVLIIRYKVFEGIFLALSGFPVVLRYWVQEQLGLPITTGNGNCRAGIFQFADIGHLFNTPHYQCCRFRNAVATYLSEDDIGADGQLVFDFA